MRGVGFEPTKLYAVALKATPFDRTRVTTLNNLKKEMMETIP